MGNKITAPDSRVLSDTCILIMQNGNSCDRCDFWEMTYRIYAVSILSTLQNKPKPLS